MQIGRIIKSVLNDKLENMGFVYEAKTSDPWIFCKRIDGREYHVGISLYRFSADGKDITFYIGADNMGEHDRAADAISRGCGDGVLPGYWNFKDEEGLSAALNDMLFVIETHMDDVIHMFDNAYDFKRITEDMCKTLVGEHEKLAQKFAAKMSDMTDNKASFIFDRIDSISNLAETSEEILQMAAYIGESYVRKNGGKWEPSQAGPNTYCEIIDEGIPKLAPLHIIKGIYTGQTDKSEFVRLLDWLD